MNYEVINLKRILEDAQQICDCIGHGNMKLLKEQIIETTIKTNI